MSIILLLLRFVYLQKSICLIWARFPSTAAPCAWILPPACLRSFVRSGSSHPARLSSLVASCALSGFTQQWQVSFRGVMCQVSMWKGKSKPEALFFCFQNKDNSTKLVIKSSHSEILIWKTWMVIVTCMYIGHIKALNFNINYDFFLNLLSRLFVEIIPIN